MSWRTLFIISFWEKLIITNYPYFWSSEKSLFHIDSCRIFLSGEFSGCSDFLQQIKDAIPLSSGWHCAYWDTWIYVVDIFHLFRGMPNLPLFLPALLLPSGIPFEFTLNLFTVSCLLIIFCVIFVIFQITFQSTNYLIICLICLKILPLRP